MESTTTISAGPAPSNDVARGPAVTDFLLVDAEEAVREELAADLTRTGARVRSASTAEEALRIATEHPPGFVVTELRLEGGDGLELVRALRQRDLATRVLVLTGFGSIAAAVEAVRAGAENVLTKPAGAEDVIAAFEKFGGPEPERRAVVTSDYKAPTLARMEWEHIQRVLADTGGNISESARRLGIHRRSLQRKIQRLGPKEGRGAE